MVRKRDIESAIASLQAHVNKLRAWGLPAAVVYSTPQGGLIIYGTNAICDVIEAHKDEIFQREDYRELFDDEEPGRRNILLPEIDPPLHERNFDSTKNLALSVVKTAFGGLNRKIGWGDPANKPVWWPVEVPWTARGIQSGVTTQGLRQIIIACYHHFGNEIQVCHV